MCKIEKDCQQIGKLGKRNDTWSLLDEQDDYVHLDVAAKRVYVQYFEHEEPYPQLRAGMVLCNEDKDKLKRWYYVEESAGQSKTRRYR
jgi:hypothetical protein